MKFFIEKTILIKINLNVSIHKTFNRNLGSLTEKWDIKVLTKYKPYNRLNQNIYEQNVYGSVKFQIILKNLVSK